MTEKLLTASEVAEWLGVPKGWVYAMSRTGDLPTVRLGRYCRFRRSSVDEWIERQESNNAGRGAGRKERSP